MAQNKHTPIPLVFAKDEDRQAFVDAQCAQMYDTRSAFEFAVDFGDWDMAESAFDAVMQIAWTVIIVHAAKLDMPLLDPTKSPDVSSLRRWSG